MRRKNPAVVKEQKGQNYRYNLLECVCACACVYVCVCAHIKKTQKILLSGQHHVT